MRIRRHRQFVCVCVRPSGHMFTAHLQTIHLCAHAHTTLMLTLLKRALSRRDASACAPFERLRQLSVEIFRTLPPMPKAHPRPTRRDRERERERSPGIVRGVFWRVCVCCSMCMCTTQPLTPARLCCTRLRNAKARDLHYSGATCQQAECVPSFPK